jgi:hypothetical protein
MLRWDGEGSSVALPPESQSPLSAISDDDDGGRMMFSCWWSSWTWPPPPSGRRAGRRTGYTLVRIYAQVSDLRVPFEEYKVNYAFLERNF